MGYGLRIGYDVRPSWRTAMAANTWAVVPATNLMTDVSPAADGIVPVGADFVARGMEAGLFSWCGGVWDEATGTWWMPLGGGHTDYGGNEPYRIQIDAEAPAWVRVRAPTGATGNEGTTRDGLEATGVYFDGRLRAVHSYNNHTFVPGLGPVVTRLAGPFYAPGSNPSEPSRCMHAIGADGEATQIANYWAVTGQPTTGSSNDGAAAFDPTRGTSGTIWTIGHGLTRLIGVDVDTGTATGYGASNVSFIASGGHMVYIPEMDVLACLSIGGLLIVRLDQASYAPVTVSLSGSYASGLTNANFVGTGFGWSAELGCLVLYQQASNTTQISTLTPSNSADPSAAWVRGSLTVAGSNAVTPPVSDVNGLFGRFGYSSRLGGCYLVTHTTTDVYFYATE